MKKDINELKEASGSTAPIVKISGPWNTPDMLKAKYASVAEALQEYLGIDVSSRLEKCLKSIDEIKSYGVNILPSEKGRDSVRQGIQLVKDQRISVTKRSLNVIKEYRNYMWLTDKDGNIINEPQPYLNHAMDAIRYAIVSLVKVKRITEEVIKEFPKERLFDEKGFY